MCRIEPDDEVGPGQPPAPLPFGVDLEARGAETRKIFAKPGERGPEVEQGADEHVASRSGETVEVDRVDHAPRPAPSPRRGRRVRDLRRRGQPAGGASVAIEVAR